jgi:hypothetical protein
MAAPSTSIESERHTSSARPPRYQPLNGSGLALGNPTNLNLSITDPQQNGRQFQAYSHYVMPGGLVESFIDLTGAAVDARLL